MNTVYWAPWTIQSLSFIEFPEVTRLNSTVTNKMKGVVSPDQGYHMCPAFQQYSENIFELKSPVNFEIVRGNGGFYSTTGDQRFWDDFVYIRNKNLVSLNIFYMFIPDFDVEIESTSAHFTDNEFTKKTMVVPGRFNAYKWLRPISCSFVIRNNVSSIKINRGDTLMYLKVCTNEKIHTRKFIPNDFIPAIVQQNLDVKNRQKKLMPLSYWYDLYESSKLRKKIMRDITSNCLED